MKQRQRNSGIIAASGVTGGGQAYASLVNGLPGGPPLAYYRLSELSGGLSDQYGLRNGTYSGVIVRGVAGLPQDSDAAVNFAGTGSALVADDAGLHLATLTLSFWFKLNAAPGALNWALFAKEKAGLNVGDFGVYLFASSTLTIQFQDGAATYSLLRAVSVGVAHHLCIRADGTGFDAYIDGQYIGKNTQFLGAWTGNTNEMRFAFSPVLTDQANAILDEVALYPRVLTEAEVVALSLRDVAPTAVADSAQAPAGGSAIIIPASGNDVFAGSASNLDFEFDTTGTGGTGISATGTGGINYTPPAGPGADAFLYRITDLIGTSEFAEVEVNVTPSGTDAYSAVVTGTPNLQAYWRLGDTAAGLLADSSGNGRNGTYPIAPSAFGLAGLTWQVSDGRSVNFGGAGYGQVAHNAVFATARGTLCGYVMANSLAAARTFINKGTGFVLQVLANGALQLTFGGTTIASVAGLIEAGIEYHVAVMWDQVAIWLMVDGRVVVWSRGQTTGLVANGSNWQFARTTGGANSTVRMDEIALYSRRLSWTEVDGLSEYIRGLPYDPTPETQQTVNSVAGIQNALQNGGGAPGHHILVAAGTYNGVTATVPAARSGLKRRPIVIRPLGGAVTFTNHAITANNRWMVFDSIKMTSGFVRFNNAACRYDRVTRCTVDTIDIHAFRMDGMFCRLDHCNLSDTQNAGAQIVNITPDIGAGACHYSLIDHNYAHDTLDTGGNGNEFIGFGTETQDHNIFIAVTAYRNLIDNTGAEGEIVSVKSKGNLLIRNTVIDQLQRPAPTYCGRHGPQTWMESEWLEDIGTNKTQNGNAGARIISGDNVIIGCHCLRSAIRLWMGDVTEAAYAAGADTNDPAIAGKYPACNNNLIIGCTRAGDGQSFIVIGHKGVGTHAVKVTGTQIDETPNIVHNAANTNGITTAPTARIPFTAAVRLAAADVGIAAADPLVPAGFK